MKNRMKSSGGERKKEERVRKMGKEVKQLITKKIYWKEWNPLFIDCSKKFLVLPNLFSVISTIFRWKTFFIKTILFTPYFPFLINLLLDKFHSNNSDCCSSWTNLEAFFSINFQGTKNTRIIEESRKESERTKVRRKEIVSIPMKEKMCLSSISHLIPFLLLRLLHFSLFLVFPS